MPGMMEKGPELLGKSRSANGGAKSPAGGGGSSANGGLHFSEPESGCSSDDEHGGTSPRSPPRPSARPPPRALLPSEPSRGRRNSRCRRSPRPAPPRPHPATASPALPRLESLCLALPLSSPYLLPFYHISWHCFADVGMRVGAEYQARIPEFDPGRYICSQENPISLSLFFSPRLALGWPASGWEGVTWC